ncbi:CheR family methyltransferase [Gemmobacter denitrificans]|uniref:Chemotaxis protein methyltransferase n=1 Tax=Gemmobacter denitrificans TaxID=3123040 RepID=A0ABU8BTN1_9RHOB
MTVHTRSGDSHAETSLVGMSDEDFRALSQLVHDRTGIVLSEGKRWMLASRLAKEINRLGLPDLAAYRKLLARPDAEPELEALTSAITTNVTSFFRGPDHFEALAALVPSLREQSKRGQRVRLWSAACSTGQEPCSIAMTLLEHWPEAAQADVRILATDIDAQVVEEARQGVYDERLLEGPAEKTIRRFSAAGPRPGTIRVVPAVRGLIRYEQLNLLGPWPFGGSFDVIFCRNVVIYFDNETRARLWHRLADRITPGGWLYIGHSERVDRALDPYLTPGGVTRYRRTATPIRDNLTAPQISGKGGPYQAKER